MGPVMQLIFEILMVTFIVYFVVRAWQRADLKDRRTRAQFIEDEYQSVNNFEQDHKDLSEKSKKVVQFKKKTF